MALDHNSFLDRSEVVLVNQLAWLGFYLASIKVYVQYCSTATD